MNAVDEHRLLCLRRDAIRARADAGAVCLVPLGALEQHGDHLPIGTDALLAEAVCLRAASVARRDVLVAPAIWTGLSPHHLRFGATATLRGATLQDVLVDVVDSIRSWCPRVLVINAHGGNRGPLATLGLESAVRSVSYWELITSQMRELCAVDHGSPGHAGQMETSLLLALAPELVATPRGAVPHEPIDPFNTALLRVEMGATGVLGDPATATAEIGRRLLDAAVRALAELVDRVVDDHHPQSNDGASA